MKSSIDINVDMGEGMGNEHLLMPYISSCNIACGGHYGDRASMRRVVQLAKQYKVKIGAHPSFPDPENFGRKVMKMSFTALFVSVKSQIQEMMKVVNEEHAALHHVKPHGALYNQAAIDVEIANVIVEVMKSIALPLKLYVPYKSVIAKVAIKHNIPIVYEAFADRNYNSNLTLVARTESNAIIKDENELFEHVFKILTTEKVNTINGREVDIKANTICVHGDNSEVVNLIKFLSKKLNQNQITIL
ncbi:MAG: 5-oxoprolinase subunit PxpA [Flavobacteriaceae bacterium]|nr:5-oxoprolinase subunit PxpA [Flavobacteriaceae bacterium]